MAAPCHYFIYRFGENAVNSVNPVWNLPSPHAKGAVLGIVHFDGARILTQSVCIDPGLP
jgi:hypothetical protein